MPADFFDDLDHEGRREAADGQPAAPAILLQGTSWPSNDRPHLGKRWGAPWSKIAERLTSPDEMPPGGKQELSVWSLAVFRNLTEHEAAERAAETGEEWRATIHGAPYRDLEHFVCATGVVLDYDSLTDDDVFKREQREKRPVSAGNRTLSAADLRRCFGRWCYLAHTSPSHRPGMARWRVILPFDGVVRDVETYRRVCDWIARHAARNGAPGLETDTAWRQPAQAFKVPARTEHYEADCNAAGNPLDIGEVLAELDAWEAEEASVPAAPEGPVDRLTPIFLPLGADWLTTPPGPRPVLLRLGTDPLAPAFLPAGKVGMLAAAGGTGKTQSLIQLAISVATGLPWLDTFGVSGPGHVLLALGEEDEEEMRRRIYYVVRELRLSRAQQEAVQERIYPLPLSGQSVVLLRSIERNGKEGRHTEYVDTPPAVKLRDLLDGAGVDWRCLIFDPASRFMGQDTETDNAAATRFVETLERFTKVRGNPSVLIAHHTGKSGLSGITDQGSARGSSAITDGVRWQANLERVTLEPARKNEKGKLLAHRTRLRLVKSNYAAFPDEPLELSRGNDGVLRPTPRDEVERESAGIVTARPEHRPYGRSNAPYKGLGDKDDE